MYRLGYRMKSALAKGFMVGAATFLLIAPFGFWTRRQRATETSSFSNEKVSAFPVNNDIAASGEYSNDEIRLSFQNHNAQAPVWNSEKFGQLPIDNLMTIQVHNRKEYLAKLIQSLEKVVGIEKSLLIITHDFISTEIDELVKNITFCRFVQLFYPDNNQLYSDVFPGDNPNDCPSRIGKDKATKLKCNNWKHPDQFGNYREATFTQMKHHWWWKLSYIFDKIPWLQKLTDWLVLLEEDYYLVPDFLHVFDLLKLDKIRLCPDCRMITLGAHQKSESLEDYDQSMDQAMVHRWNPPEHNMAMAVSRSLWEDVKSCAETFCNFDDYNYDWSLMNANLNCLKPSHFSVLLPKSPRVFHIGNCGTHHANEKSCRPDSTSIDRAVKKSENFLFPTRLKAVQRKSSNPPTPRPNGGWADPRDRALCMNQVRK